MYVCMCVYIYIYYTGIYHTYIHFSEVNDYKCECPAGYFEGPNKEKDIPQTHNSYVCICICMCVYIYIYIYDFNIVFFHRAQSHL